MRFIADLREGDHISGIYLCKNKQSLKTKAGKSYYSMLLQDKTGTLDAKVWDLNNGIEHFESMENNSRFSGHILHFLCDL